MLSTILSYLFDVLYNILIRQELKIWFSCREAGVTPKLLKRAAREELERIIPECMWKARIDEDQTDTRF